MCWFSEGTFSEGLIESIFFQLWIVDEIHKREK
uniref:Uncharacterized protein n=1 Tax=Candidozyma auris TaxID=498019 RepID=A0A0L0NVI6_CANAR